MKALPRGHVDTLPYRSEDLSDSNISGHGRKTHATEEHSNHLTARLLIQYYAETRFSPLLSFFFSYSRAFIIVSGKYTFPRAILRKCRWKDHAIRETLKMLLRIERETIWILHSFRGKTTTTIRSCALSLSRERAFHSRASRVLHRHSLCLSRYTRYHSFYRSTPLFRRIRFAADSPHRRTLTNDTFVFHLDHSFPSHPAGRVRSPFLPLSFFPSFFYLFYSSSMSRFNATLLSPLPFSRALSASSLRFHVYPNADRQRGDWKCWFTNAKPGRYPHHRPVYK